MTGEWSILSGASTSTLLRLRGHHGRVHRRWEMCERLSSGQDMAVVPMNSQGPLLPAQGYPSMPQRALLIQLRGLQRMKKEDMKVGG